MAAAVALLGCGIPLGIARHLFPGSFCLVICEHLYNQLYSTFRRLSVINIPLEETSAFNLQLLSNFRYWSPGWRNVESSCIAFWLEHRLRPFIPASRLFSIHGFARGHHVVCERAERHAKTHHLLVEVTCLIISVHRALQPWRK